MNTKQLRQKILDLAIHGKLVPQDPNDEPASVLLERIRAEKERLIKEGKIKRSKNDSIIIRGDDKSHYGNVPFKAPESWVWCRLGDICFNFQYGTSKKSDKSGDVAVLRMGNLQDGELDYGDLAFTSDASDIEKYSLLQNELLFNRTNSSEWVGKTAVYRGDIPAIFAGYIIRIKPINVDPFYLNYLMNSEYHRKICSRVKTDGVNQSNINAQKLSNFIYPIAPFAEQYRIVAAIESAFAVIEEIEKTKADLQTAVTAAKSKILSLAISGKLVPQDPADEPAGVLLERIRKEREQLIKQGKIKRGKTENAIIRRCDNCYYGKLPPGWTVTELIDIADIIMGQSPVGASVTDKRVGLEFHQGKIHFTERYLACSGLYTVEYNKKAPNNSVLLCVRAPVGAVNITDREIAIGRGLCAIYPLAGISAEFIFHWLTTFKNFLIEQATGTTFQAISIEIVKSLHIPFPPKNEQTKIVTTIENAFGCLNEIIISLG